VRNVDRVAAAAGQPRRAAVTNRPESRGKPTTAKSESLRWCSVSDRFSSPSIARPKALLRFHMHGHTAANTTSSNPGVSVPPTHQYLTTLDPVPRTQPYAATPLELILIHFNLGHTYRDEWLITYPISLSFFSDIQDSNNIVRYIMK
jgi:hypothetical protein